MPPLPSGLEKGIPGNPADISITPVAFGCNSYMGAAKHAFLRIILGLMLHSGPVNAFSFKKVQSLDSFPSHSRSTMNELFRHFAHSTSEIVGSSWSFIVAVLMIVVWFMSGSLFDYSDTWQLVINTGTTIVTFLMVFLIQNTQTRDAKAIQLKLDELIRAAEQARNTLVDLEDLSDEELEKLQQQFTRLREREANNGDVSDGQRGDELNEVEMVRAEKQDDIESRKE